MMIGMEGGDSFGISVDIDKVVGVSLDGGLGGRSGPSRLGSHRSGGSGNALVRDLGLLQDTPGFGFLRRFLRCCGLVFCVVRFLSKDFPATRYRLIEWQMGYMWSSFLLSGDPSVKVEDRILCFCFEQVMFVLGLLVENMVE
jgi:hypothetical protein